MSSLIEELKGKLNVEAMQEATLEEWWNAEFSLCIAKISQGLRKFRYAQIFTKLAKITVHSENLNFAMPCFFFAIIAKFCYHSENFAMLVKFPA